MSRTTTTLVQNMLGRDYDGTTDLQQWIDMAESVVDDVVAVAAAERGVTLSDDRLEKIERLLSCHMYQAMDQAFASKSTEGASASFQGKTDMYLEETKYGMRAMLLDSSGVLKALYGCEEKKVARMSWLGKPPSAQIPYDWRR